MVRGSATATLLVRILCFRGLWGGHVSTGLVGEASACECGVSMPTGGSSALKRSAGGIAGNFAVRRPLSSELAAKASFTYAGPCTQVVEVCELQQHDPRSRPTIPRTTITLHTRGGEKELFMVTAWDASRLLMQKPRAQLQPRRGGEVLRHHGGHDNRTSPGGMHTCHPRHMIIGWFFG